MVINNFLLVVIFLGVGMFQYKIGELFSVLFHIIGKLQMCSKWVLKCYYGFNYILMIFVVSCW